MTTRLPPAPGRRRAPVALALLAAATIAPVAAAPAIRLAAIDAPSPTLAARPAVEAARPIASLGEGGRPLRIRGSVGDSIYRSARAAGVPAGTVQQYLRALDSQVLLEEDVLPTDTFDLVIARRAGGGAQAGDVLYASLEREGALQAQLLRWGKDGELQAPGEVAGADPKGLLAPLPGRVTSGYGLRRHPILRTVRMHAGVDIRARHGAPVRAAADGVVAYAGWRGGYGTFVRLSHAGGLGSGYAHLSRVAVAPGARVRAGEVIGHVGSTGLSTGPHLHYELYRHGRPVDPRTATTLGIDPARAREQAAVRARIAALRRIAPRQAPPPAELASAAPAVESVAQVD